MTEILEDKIYIKYARDVLNGNIITGEDIKLACRRFFNFFDDPRYIFKYEEVDKKIRLVSKIKHAEGRFAGQPFILLPYQQWIYASIYGFYYADEPDIRLTTQALIMIARKGGKSFLAASFAIVGAIADGEASPSIAFIANSASQASILFKHCSDQCRSLDPDNRIFQRYRHDIRIPALSGKIQILSSDTTKLDGRGDSLFIQDEGHEAKSTEIYNILRTGQGARKNPLAISISTTGFNVGEYPLYMQWENAQDVLRGTKEDDSLFAAIYQMDPEDDWKDENVWIKSNPSLNITVPIKYMKEQIQAALNNPSNEVSVKTKNLNMWCNSSTVWIPREALLEHSEKIDFAQFKDAEYYCYGGIDLASVSDLSAVAYMVKRNDKFYFKCDAYLPDGSVEKSKNKDLYRKWINEGYLKVTHGKRANYEEIAADIYKNNEIIPIYEMAYDKYNSVELTRLCNERGLIMTSYSQTKGNFNLATKEFERRLFNGDIVIDDNPVIRWCFANAQLEYDKMDNCKPVKGAGSSLKIDCVIAILQAFGIYLQREENFGTISTI